MGGASSADFDTGARHLGIAAISVLGAVGAGGYVIGASRKQSVVPAPANARKGIATVGALTLVGCSAWWLGKNKK